MTIYLETSGGRGQIKIVVTELPSGRCELTCPDLNCEFQIKIENLYQTLGELKTEYEALCDD
jgi:hypothetical protein